MTQHILPGSVVESGVFGTDNRVPVLYICGRPGLMLHGTSVWFVTGVDARAIETRHVVALDAEHTVLQEPP